MSDHEEESPESPPLNLAKKRSSKRQISKKQTSAEINLIPDPENTPLTESTKKNLPKLQLSPKSTSKSKKKKHKSKVHNEEKEEEKQKNLKYGLGEKEGKQHSNHSNTSLIKTDPPTDLKEAILRFELEDIDEKDHDYNKIIERCIGKGFFKIPQELTSKKIWKWDFLMVLPNPEYGKEEGSISFKDAINLYEKLFPSSFPNRRHKTQTLAFLNSFFELKNSQDNPNEKIKKLGGRYKKLEKEGSWKDTGKGAKDFSQLIINMILMKLTDELKLETELLFSTTGEQIFILIRGHDSFGEKVESHHEFCEFEAGSIDLDGFEPIDSNFSKLRDLEKNCSSELKKQILKREGRLIHLWNPNYREERKALPRSKSKYVGEDNVKRTTNLSLTESHWNLYKRFLDIIISKYEDYQEEIAKNPQFQGGFIRELLMKSKEEANEEEIRILGGGFCCCSNKRNSHLLRTIHDYYEMNQLLPISTSYLESANSKSSLLQFFPEEKVTRFYKHFCLNEDHTPSFFSNVARIKLITKLIEESMSISELSENKILIGFIPLHNNFEKDGSQRNLEEFADNSEEQYQSSEENNKDTKKKKAHSKKNKTKKHDNERQNTEEIPLSYPEALKISWRCKIFSILYPPLLAIRNYFGEKIAYFFNWVSLYSLYLAIVSFLSLLGYPLLSGYGLIPEDTILEDAFYFLFAFLPVFWVTFFMEHLKKSEGILSFKFGQMNFATAEKVRTEFTGTIRRSPITPSCSEIYYPYKRRIQKMILTYIATIIMIILTVIISLLLISLKGIIIEEADNEFLTDNVSTISSALNAITIVVFNIIFNLLSTKLTNFENHRTMSNYESSLIIKTFLFQSFNSYFSFVYIGFFKRHTEGCIGENENGEKVTSSEFSCVDELTTQLTSIFVIAVLVNIIGICIPLVKLKAKDKLRQRTQAKIKGPNYRPETITEKVLENMEKEFIKDDYSMTLKTIDGTYDSNLYLVNQFGYIVMFALAFPAGPLLALISNLIRLSVERYKLMYLLRRPPPLSTNSIGIWKNLLELLSYIAIFSNLGILCFTSNTFDEDGTEQYYYFILLSFIFISLKFIVKALVSKYPSNYMTIHERNIQSIWRSLISGKEKTE